MRLFLLELLEMELATRQQNVSQKVELLRAIVQLGE